jgi:hypothetical protein
VGASPEEMDGGTWCPAAGLKRVTSLLWTSKTFSESEIALLLASTPMCRHKTLDRA